MIKIIVDIIYISKRFSSFICKIFLVYPDYHMTENQLKLKNNFNKILSFYLDVEYKSEFIEKQKHLNDKTLNDLNGTQTQFDFFSFITLAIPYKYYLKTMIEDYKDIFSISILKTFVSFWKMLYLFIKL